MKKYKDITAFFVVTLLFVTPALNAQTTWYVDDDAPGDPGPGDPDVSDPLEDGSASHLYDAIQEGIDASSNGDTVLVADGTYTGTGNRDLDFGGKSITVRSENGPDNCIIDCEGTYGYRYRGFYFHSGEGPYSVVQGLTIQNGFEDVGGGIYCENAAPTISHNIVTHNEATVYGGGICCEGGSPMIIDNTITDNYVWGGFMNGGGGIYCQSSSASPLKKAEALKSLVRFYKKTGRQAQADVLMEQILEIKENEEKK